MDDFLMQLRAIEKKWQDRWQKSNIFNAVMDIAKPKWFFTVPYPYASGPLHIGHCRTYTLGDIFARFKRQTGYNVLWPMAFHVTGTPILAISAKIQSRDPAALKLYLEYVGIYEKDAKQAERIVASFADPKSVAMYFSTRLMADFKRMGFSIDDTRQFTTADPEYSKFIEWQYRILMEKGYIVKASYPILWCVECKNAVGEDDIQGGDEDPVELVEFCGIKFRLDDGTFLVAATLRPETIAGATNLWVHPRAVYQELDVNSERWIVSREAAGKIAMQGHDRKVVRNIDGRELLGKYVEVPLSQRRILILPAEFVDPDHATGIVYSVPAHAPYDYIALADLQNDNAAMDSYRLDPAELSAIQPVSIVIVDGFGDYPAIETCQEMGVTNQHDSTKLDAATQRVYKAEYYTGVMRDNTGELHGLHVEEAKQRAKEWLIRGKLAVLIYEPSRKASCRCGGRVIVAVILDQYFLNYGDPSWKAKASSALVCLNITPPKYRQAFENVFAWLDKRPCARKRGLGTELPFSEGKGWIIESLSDSTIYMAFYTVINHVHGAGITANQLIPSVFDLVFLSTGDEDSVSKESGIPIRVLQEMRDEFMYWYPNDLRHTAIAHVSNHLSFAIFHHAAIFPEKHWLQAISLNEMLIREGQKMGKSKGNVIPIAQVPEQYSVDLTRFHLASIAAADTVMDWRDKEIEHSLKALKKFWDLAIRFGSYHVVSFRQLHFPSKAFTAAIKIQFKRAIDAMERFNAREYIQESFHAVLSLIDQYDEVASAMELDERFGVIQKAIKDLIVIIAPVIPHICEELYSRPEGGGIGTDFVSLKKVPTFQPSRDDYQLMLQASFVMRVNDDIGQIIKMISIIPKRIHVCFCAAWKHELFQMCQELFQSTPVSIIKLIDLAKITPTLNPHLNEIAREAKSLQSNPGLFKVELLDPTLQREAIEGYRAYMERIFKAVFILHNEDDPGLAIPQSKANKAKPMKPAIWIE